MTNMNEKIFDKKADGWRFEANDFVAENELMVTITLAEYRSLIENNAKADQKYNDLLKRKNEVDEQLERTKRENEKLRESFINSKIDED